MFFNKKKIEIKKDNKHTYVPNQCNDNIRKIAYKKEIKIKEGLRY